MAVVYPTATAMVGKVTLDAVPLQHLLTTDAIHACRCRRTRMFHHMTSVLELVDTTCIWLVYGASMIPAASPSSGDVRRSRIHMPEHWFCMTT